MPLKFPKLSAEEISLKLNIPSGKIRLVIDTDAKNEVDDQFAVSWALRSPERFQVDAVYAAPFSGECFKKLDLPISNLSENDDNGNTYVNGPGYGMEASYQELLKLYALLGENPEGRVFRGSTAYIENAGKPVESEAAKDLISRAMSSNETLYVAAIGAPTNIASALLMEPELVRKIVVIWLGGQPLYYPHGIEFNLMQDVAASRVLFDSGVPLVLIPCMNTASLLTLTESEIQKHMRGKNAICDYLSNIVLDEFASPKACDAALRTPFIMRQLYMKQREDRSDEYLSQFGTNHNSWSRIIWDISTIAFLKNPNWTPSTLEHSPVLNDDLAWGAKDETRHFIRVVNYCWRDLIFGDMIACLTK